MLELPISVKNGNVSIIYNTDYLEETMYAEKKGELLKKNFNKLVEDINKIRKEKLKPGLKFWKLGERIHKFYEWSYDEAIQPLYVYNALADAITGHNSYWRNKHFFYVKNKDKEYVNFPAWFCEILGWTAEEDIRKKLIEQYVKKLIRNKKDMITYREELK
jgi:hypothetical protein